MKTTTTTTSETSDHYYQRICSKLIQHYLDLGTDEKETIEIEPLACIILGVNPAYETLNPIRAKALKDIELFFKPVSLPVNYTIRIHQALKQAKMLAAEQPQIYTKLIELLHSAQKIELTKNEVFTIHELLLATGEQANLQLAKTIFSRFHEHENIKETLRTIIVDILKKNSRVANLNFKISFTLADIVVWSDMMKAAGIQSFSLNQEELHQFSERKWRAFCAALQAAGIQSLDLHYHYLYLYDNFTDKNWQAFCTALQATSIQSLGLSHNYLYNLTDKKWLTLCAALQAAGIQSLHLNENKLYQLSERKWQALGATLKAAGVRSLNLFCNNLSNLTNPRWKVFCAALQGSKIQSLNLRWNNLYVLTDSRWRALGAALKTAGIQSLDLSWNSLYKLSYSRWKAFCAVLQGSSIQSLDLRENHLGNLTVSCWQAFGTALKTAGIQFLNLGLNELSKLTDPCWQAFCAALQGTGIQSLGLSSNDLYKLTDLQWQTLGTALQAAGIQSLNLSNNDLYKLTAPQWRAFGTALQAAGIQSLDLSSNDLYKLIDPQWLALGIALQAAGIQSLNLSNNDLYKLTDPQWQAFCQTLEKSDVISLEFNQRLPPSRTFNINRILFQNQCRFVLQTLFKRSAQLDAFLEEFATQGFEVKEEALIDFLANSNDPYDMLFAAFLLFDDCNNAPPEQRLEEDIENRVLNAIDLLLNARALEPALAEQITHYLWLKESLFEEGSNVAKILQSLALKPAGIETYKKFNDLKNRFFQPAQADKNNKDIVSKEPDLNQSKGLTN